MRTLLVSTYELGHQPLHVASPAAALLAAGHEVRAHDLSVEQWDPPFLDARARRPDLPICFYGRVAPVGRDADMPASEEGTVSVHLGRSGFLLPARHLLPPLDRYARLAIGDEERLAGYVEGSHGCTFRCCHCPVRTVYDGRIRIVDHDVVVADVDALVAAGARHLTFGDPDFLNGAKHSLRLVRAIHERHPDLTFDCTTKVELVLRHAGVWEELAAAGCLFVTSAVECVNDEILERLDKGHTTADAVSPALRPSRRGSPDGVWAPPVPYAGLFRTREPGHRHASDAPRRREAMRSLWATLELINNEDKELTRARSRDHH